MCIPYPVKYTLGNAVIHVHTVPSQIYTRQCNHSCAHRTIIHVHTVCNHSCAHRTQSKTWKPPTSSYYYTLPTPEMISYSYGSILFTLLNRQKIHLLAMGVTCTVFTSGCFSILTWVYLRDLLLCSSGAMYMVVPTSPVSPGQRQ